MRTEDPSGFSNELLTKLSLQSELRLLECVLWRIH